MSEKVKINPRTTETPEAPKTDVDVSGVQRKSAKEALANSGSIKSTVTEQTSSKKSSSNKKASNTSADNTSDKSNLQSTTANAQIAKLAYSSPSSIKTFGMAKKEEEEAKEKAANRTIAEVAKGPSNEEPGKGSEIENLTTKAVDEGNTPVPAETYEEKEPERQYPSAAAGASLATMVDANLTNVTPRPELDVVRKNHGKSKKDTSAAPTTPEQPSEAAQETSATSAKPEAEPTVDVQEVTQNASERQNATSPLNEVELTENPSTIRQNEANADKHANEDPGNSIWAMLHAASDLKIDQAYMSARLIMQQYRRPKTHIKKIVDDEIARRSQTEPEFAEIDPIAMEQDDAYCIGVICEIFNGSIPAVYTKWPTTETPSQRCVYPIAIDRDGIFIHPITAGIANEDFDSDEVAIFFDIDHARELPRASDLLIAQNGNINIKPEVWSPTSWGEDINSASLALGDILKTSGVAVRGQGSGDPYARLAEALYYQGVTNDDDIDPEVEVGKIIRLVCHMAKKNFFTHLDGTRFANSSEAVSEVLNIIWRENISIKHLGIDVLGNETTSYGEFWDATTHTPFENLLRHPNEPGEMPPNLMDFLAAYDTALSLGHKNAPFRSVANVVGQDKKNLTGVGYQWTNSQRSALALLSAAANMHVAGSDKLLHVKTFIRIHVFLKMGTPPQIPDGGVPQDINEELADWEVAFAKEYNTWAQIASNATAVQSTDGGITRFYDCKKDLIDISKKNKIKDMHAFVNAFRDVFQDFTMDSLFSKRTMNMATGGEDVANATMDLRPDGWDKMTLTEWISQTDWLWSSNARDFKSPSTVYSLLNYLSNSRTWLGANLDTALGGFYDEHGKSLRRGRNKKGQEYSKKPWGFFDQFARKTDLTPQESLRFIEEISSNVWTQLGLTFANARENPLIKAFFDENHKTAQAKRSVFYAMHVQAKVQALANYEKINDFVNADKELSELSTISPLWYGLVKDYRNGGLAIPTLLDVNASLEEKERICLQIGRKEKNTLQPQEIAFQLIDDPHAPWGSPYEGRGHQNLASTVRDTTGKLDAYSTRCYDFIQRDVNRAKAAWRAEYNSTRIDNLKILRESLATEQRTIGQVNPNLVSDAILASLQATLNSKNKADAEAAVSLLYSACCNVEFGGEYSDWSQLNDFSMNTISLRDLQHNPSLIARMFCDKTFSIQVYDGMKQPIVINYETLLALSSANRALFARQKREAADFFDSSEAWWNLFEEYPQIAACLRPTEVMPRTMNDSQRTDPTKNYTTAVSSFESLMTNTEVNKSQTLLNKLAKYPIFSAMASALVEIPGKTPNQVRGEMTEAVMQLTRHIQLAAFNIKNNEKSTIASEVNELVPDELVDYLEKIYGTAEERTFFHLDENGIMRDDFSIDDVAGTTVQYMREALTTCIQECMDSNLEENFTQEDIPPTDWKLGNAANINLFYVTTSTLTGAKVARGVPINGAMDIRVTGLDIICGHQGVEDCGSHEHAIKITLGDLLKNIDKYRGLRLADENHTIIDDDTIADMALAPYKPTPEEEQSDEELPENNMDTVVGIELPEYCTSPWGCCQAHGTADLQAKRRNTQGASALGRGLIMLRSLSADFFLLQLKKAGIDGQKPMTRVYGKDLLNPQIGKDIRNKVKRAFNKYRSEEDNNQQALAAAYRQLGYELHNLYSKTYDYTDLGRQDWTDIAHWLIHERVNKEDLPQSSASDPAPDLVVLSLSELASICQDAQVRTYFETAGEATNEETFNDILTAISSVIERQTRKINTVDVLKGIDVRGFNSQGYAGVSAQYGSAANRNAQTYQEFAMGNDAWIETHVEYSGKPEPRLEAIKTKYSRDNNILIYEDKTGLVAHHAPKKFFKEHTSYSNRKDPLFREGKKAGYTAPVNGVDKFFVRRGDWAQYLDKGEEFIGAVWADFNDDGSVTWKLNSAIQPGVQSVLMVDPAALKSKDGRLMLKNAAKLCQESGMTLRLPWADITPKNRDQLHTILGEEGLDIWNASYLRPRHTIISETAGGRPKKGGGVTKPRAAIHSKEWLDIPFFDVRQNQPGLGREPGTFSAGTYRMRPEDIQVMVEVDRNYVGLGDSQAIACPKAQRGMVVCKNGTSKQRPASMFVNLRDHFGSFSDARIFECDNNDEVHDIITRWLDESEDSILFDTPLGKEELESRMTKFIGRWEEDELKNGFVRENVARGDIIGFMKCLDDWTVDEKTGEPVVIYHPLQFVPDTENRDAPDGSNITSIGMGIDGWLHIAWQFVGGLRNRILKIIDGLWTSNKYTVFGDEKAPNASLESGREVDFITSSFNSRPRRDMEVLSNDMNSLVTLAQEYEDGYNAALDIDGFLPQNPELREAIATGTVTLEDWENALYEQVGDELKETTVDFFPGLAIGRLTNANDDHTIELQRVNAWLNKVCRKLLRVGINPMHFIASNYTSDITRPNSARKRDFIYFDYSFAFESNDGYADNLLTFFNMINPRFCAHGRYDTSMEHLFDNQFRVRVMIDDVQGQPLAIRQHITVTRFLAPEYSGFDTGNAEHRHATDLGRATVEMRGGNAGDNVDWYTRLINAAAASWYEAPDPDQAYGGSLTEFDEV